MLLAKQMTGIITERATQPKATNTKLLFTLGTLVPADAHTPDPGLRSLF